MAHDSDIRIGCAVAALRKKRQMTQDELARRLGVRSAQIVSSIEKGQRSLKAAEAADLARILRVPLGDLLTGESPPEPFVLWRDEPGQAEAARADEQALFLLRCRRYAHVEELMESQPSADLPSFNLRLDRARFEDMEDWGEGVRSALRLGEIPAPRLRQALEEQAGIKVFLSELRGGSGAATRGDFGPAILENRSEPETRRAYSLAHELFHLLTWDSVAARETELSSQERERNEQLANVFASAFLMPEAAVRQRLDHASLERPAWHRLLPVAAAFAVSPPALLWRMVNLGLMSKPTAQRLEGMRRDREEAKDQQAEPPLPRRFVLIAFRAWAEGKMSLGKLAEVLETTVGLLEPSLADYGIDMEQDAQEAEDLPA